ncbi:hypothetical protein [Silvibacterium acidisoli]|uniref:hypothetical protein n=1 Tax=Acidobacteriaceae bacterium ZG23-2 TaxID=2883246 RepID=UPI00406CB69E
MAAGRSGAAMAAVHSAQTANTLDAGARLSTPQARAGSGAAAMAATRQPGRGETAAMAPDARPTTR